MKVVSNTKTKQRSTFLSTIILSALLFSIATNYFQNLNAIPLYIDEWLFMGKSYYFDLLFINRNLSDKRWYEPDGLVAEPTQPKLGPYVFGAALRAAGVKDIDAYQQKIDYYKTSPHF